MIKFFLILLCTVFLYGGEAENFFANFDKNFDSASQLEKRKFHNNLKDLYLKTATKDKKNRIPTLQRLVYSSEILGYNANSYKDELKRLGAKTSFKPNKTAEKKSEKYKILASSKPQKISSNENKNNENKNLEKSPNAKLKLNSLQKEKNALIINFNRNIKDSDYKNFKISSVDNHRFVIDFKANLGMNNQNISDFIYDEIKIAQFDEKTTRIVLKNSSKFEPNLQISENSLIISKDANALASNKKSKTQKNTKTVKNTQNDYETATVVSSNKRYKSTSGKVIVIDPGHGGKDAGAVGNGLKEKNIVLSTAKKLGALLSKRGYKVLYTRSSDVFINLKSRTAFANKKNADMFISIHANAAPNAKSSGTFNGIETFFLSPARSERSKNAAALENKGDLDDMNHFSKQTFLNFLNREKIIASNKLAIDIQSYMLSAVKSSFGSRDGGVREAPFWVLVGATMPAVLVEMGYITHPKEGKNLGKSNYQDKIAAGIASGVDAYFQKNR